MPIYEYACTRCDHHFDVRHGADEKPALSCPRCEGDVRKVFHAAGIIFKGSGWYITDSAAKGNGNGNDRNAETKSEPAPAVTKAEPAPAAAKTE